MQHFRSALESFLVLKTPNTARTYRTAISVWCEFLRAPLGTRNGVRRFLSARSHHALKFLADTKRAGRSDATLRLRYSALRAIYQHLVNMEIAERNPFAQAASAISWRQRVQVRPTKTIPLERVCELLDAPSQRTKDGVRDRAILAILFGCGLRRSEVTALDVGSVGVTPGGLMYVELGRTKAGKERQQPIPPWAEIAFSVLVSQRKSEGAGPGDPLFVVYFADGRPSNRMSDYTLYNRFKHWCRACKINAAPHAARAAAASMLKELGYEDRDVAEFLGHATEKMVRVYDKRRRGVSENAGASITFPGVK